jgi:hypothetical protein
MKYDFFYKVIYSFELTIQILIFKCKSLIQLSIIDYLVLLYDLCNIMYFATMYMDLYFNTSMDSTYVRKYYTLVCIHPYPKFQIFFVLGQSIKPITPNKNK